MKKIFLIFISFFLISISLPGTASAQFKEWGDCVDKVQVPDPNDKDAPPTISEVPTLRCVPVIFQNVVTAFLMFAGAVALVLIIYSGIKLVTSGGDPKQVQAARQIMTYAIIGTIIIMSSFAIIYFIGYITNSKDCITDINQINTGGCK